MQNLNTIYRGIFEKIEHLSVRGPFSKSPSCCYGNADDDTSTTDRWGVINLKFDDDPLSLT